MGRRTRQWLDQFAVVHWLRARRLLPWRSLVPAEDFTRSCEMVLDELQQRGASIGDYIEFGVSRGTSMACMHGALARAGLDDVRLVGFDSFEGLPPEAAGQGWEPGAFASTKAATTSYLESSDVDLERVRLVEGWFSETLNADTVRDLGLGRASIVMVDCDIYTASREALDFVGPLLADPAVLIFDDWGWREDDGELGQKEAFDEFLGANPGFEVTRLPAYIPQARIFVLTR